MERSNLRHYMSWLAASRGLAQGFGDYESLWRWSVTDLEAFWASIWEYFTVRSHTPYTRVLADRRMPGTHWFEGATLNYAEHALARRSEHLAIIYRSEDGSRRTLTYAELADKVARAAAGLKALGVGRGDRVVGYVPNSAETVICFLAAASLGAIWSSCPPEFGVKSVLDRFRQIEPKVLIATNGYPYGGKFFQRSAEVAEIAKGLPSLQSVIVLDRLGSGLPAGWLSYDELLQRHEELTFAAVPFDHPLWILYSSGTTGLPKPIVHGHGGILLELYKVLSLHSDLKEDDRFFWFSTTGWMMWNYLVSGLLVGTTIVLYEGSPGYPDLLGLWRMAAEEKVTYFGTSAPFLMACRKAGIRPKDVCDLSAIRAVGSTGAPLPADGFVWVYEAVGEDLLLGSVSGGTDVCTAFVCSCPLLPVYAGELQCRALGAHVQALGSGGKPVYGEVGELVVAEPLPSMPIYFWNDPDGERLIASYFAEYPGLWRHGDWIEITERGSCVIYGRSDSTLNRGGVRMGTSEFYDVVEALPGVIDSVVVDTGSLTEEGKLWLFVVLAEGQSLTAQLVGEMKSALRQKLSPRHVPDEIRAVSEVPRTLSGKKLEVPIKRIMAGAKLEDVVNPGTLKNPAAIYEVVKATQDTSGS